MSERYAIHLKGSVSYEVVDTTQAILKLGEQTVFAAICVCYTHDNAVLVVDALNKAEAMRCKGHEY